MKDSYPRTRVLPYVLLGIVLFCFALSPAEWWEEVLSEFFPSIHQNGPRLAHPPIVVVEREVSRARVSITAESVKPQTATEPQSRLPRGRAQHRPDQSATPKRHVWLPPEGWVPRPIQPLRVRPEPPVAKRMITASDLRGAPRAETVEPTAELPPSLADTASALPVAQPDNTPEVPQLPPITPPGDDNTRSQANEQAERVSAPPAAEQLVAGWPSADEVQRLLADGDGDPQLGPWIDEIRLTLQNLEGKPITGDLQQQQMIRQLQQLSRQVGDMSHWSAEQVRLYHRIRFAIQRRAAVWEPLAQLAYRRLLANKQLEARKRLAVTAHHLKHQLTRSATQSWVATLRLRELTQLQTNKEQSLDRQTAEAVLQQLANIRRGAALADPIRQQLNELERSLRLHIAAHVSLSGVLHALENYGADPTQEHAADLIARLQRVTAIEDFDPAIDAMQLHYRNANVRIAISENLINRAFPAFHEYAERVNDTILGAAVRGQNSTLTNLSVRLLPDPRRLHFQLLANGQVRSNTTSRKGPVTLFNRGRSTFTAGKQLIIQPEGVYLSATQAEAVTGNRLIRLQTELDSVPLIGWMMRGIAERQQHEQRGFLRAEILRRVKQSARERMDQEVSQRVTSVEKKLDARVMLPLQRMQLDPRAIEMRTTKQRVILRTRLASNFQLGAHTPRPQARADSRLSLQLHQSAVNNVIAQLSLQGRRMTVEELFAEVSARLGLTLQPPNEQRRDAVIHFAEQHPMEVEFDNGQVAMTLRFKELVHDRRKWKNFAARATYRADARQLDVELVREDGIELISDRLRMGDQVALRGIFTKVFAKNQRLAILRGALADQRRLQDLRVTQLTIRDGWIGIAIGDVSPSTYVARRRTSR